MTDLRRRFGQRLAAHRRRHGLTQEALAEAAGLSVDMISKIEVGATGARFPSIERLAKAVDVDPADLFSDRMLEKSLRPGAFSEISSKLADLSEADLIWVNALLEVALNRGDRFRQSANVERLEVKGKRLGRVGGRKLKSK